MMQYDKTFAEVDEKQVETAEDHDIRLSENLSYVFRMFLVSMVFIVAVLVLST